MMEKEIENIRTTELKLMLKERQKREKNYNY